MKFESQKAKLDITGYRCYPTLSICERVINSYGQLDRYIEVLESHRNFMRDGKPADKEGTTINITI